MRRSVRAAARVMLMLVVVTVATGAWASPQGTWVIQTTPTPGTITNEFRAVTTTSSTNAWAVGTYVDVHFKTLIEHYDGTSWTQQSSPSPGTNDELLAIKAISSTDVWAVGQFFHTSGYFRVLTEHYDGTKWSRIPAVSYVGQENYLAGVAAPTSTNVWAVGGHTCPITGADCPLIEHWDGTAWKLQAGATAPCGATKNAVLSAASAASTTSVWAAGYSNNPASQTFVEHYDGTSWVLQTAQNPDADEALYGVSAAASSDVWAVGWSSADGLCGHDVGLIEHYDGSTWTVVQAPFPGVSSDLYAVKARSSTDAWAVGAYFTSAECFAPGSPLIMHWDGKSWTQQSAAAIGYSDVLKGVAASSSTNVFAAGIEYPDATTKSVTLVEHCC